VFPVVLFVLRYGENLLALKQSNSFFYRHREKNILTCVGLKRQSAAKWNFQANKVEVIHNYKSAAEHKASCIMLIII